MVNRKLIDRSNPKLVDRKKLFQVADLILHRGILQRGGVNTTSTVQVRNTYEPLPQS